VIWPIYGLKNGLHDIFKITSPKIRHQNDVKFFSVFQDPPLAKSCAKKDMKITL